MDANAPHTTGLIPPGIPVRPVQGDARELLAPPTAVDATAAADAIATCRGAASYLRALPDLEYATAMEMKMAADLDDAATWISELVAGER